MQINYSHDFSESSLRTQHVHGLPHGHLDISRGLRHLLEACQRLCQRFGSLKDVLELPFQWLITVDDWDQRHQLLSAFPRFCLKEQLLYACL